MTCTEIIIITIKTNTFVVSWEGLEIPHSVRNLLEILDNSLPTKL